GPSRTCLSPGPPAKTSQTSESSRVARTIDGKAVAATVRGEVRERVGQLAQRETGPGLATGLGGDAPAAPPYAGSKERACREVGIRSFGHQLPASTSQAELLALVGKLGRDPNVHGILVQLPLPAGLDAQQVIEALPPEKDVDGLHPVS